jgi:hypothetical protein
MMYIEFNAKNNNCRYKIMTIKKTIPITMLWSVIAASSAVFSIYYFYDLFNITLRLSEVIAALVLPTLTVPFIVYHTSAQHIKIHKLEKEAEIRNASLTSHKNSLDASNHIINNLMTIFKSIIHKREKGHEIDDSLIEKLNKSIDKAIKQMEVLNTVENPLETDQYKEIYPYCELAPIESKELS